VEGILILALMIIPPMNRDPAPGAGRTIDASRRLVCDNLSVEQGSQQRPGQILPERARGDFVERNVVVCRQLLIPPNLRAPRDEAVLAELDTWTADYAMAVQSLRPDLADHNWMVEVYYPSAPVSTKIGFAAKNALMGQGLSVTDRTPTLAVGDIDVLTRLPPSLAYPAACERYTDIGGIGDDDVLLALVTRDPRETILHAGLCTGGHWTWLR
jgi:hypothetical protein